MCQEWKKKAQKTQNVEVRQLQSALVFKGDKISEDDIEGHVERMGEMYVTVWSRETGCETCVQRGG